jgi:hypothetical protein
VGFILALGYASPYCGHVIAFVDSGDAEVAQGLLNVVVL